MTKSTFAYIWEYTIQKDYLENFKKLYGPNGDWVRLFRKANGYIATDLHQDQSNPEKFITVDFWESKEDRDIFLTQFPEEYKDLDEQCEFYTLREQLLGEFDSYVYRFSGNEANS